VCADCEREALDLRTFKEGVAHQFVRGYEPAAAREDKRGTRWQKFADLWRLPAGWPPLPAAAISISLLLALAAGAWFVWRSRADGTTQTQIAQAPDAAPAAPQVSVDPSPTDDVRGVVGTTPLPPTEIVLTLNDGGGRVTLDGEGNLAGVGALPPAQQEIVKAALKTGKAVNSSALAGLGGRGGTLMGDAGAGESFALKSPAAVVVEGARPTFRWDALGGATSYRVTVYDSNFNAVATSPPLSAQAWTIPDALARGAIYSWQVTATKDDREIKSPKPPAPEAKFKVLEAAKAGELQRARRANPRSHLTLGILYAQAGLLDAAERELRALLGANPQSDVARRLLAHVRAAKKAGR
jgi:hypothetical protein